MPPTNEDLVFVTVPFPLCYDDIFDDTSATPCSCSEAKNTMILNIFRMLKSS